MKKILFFIAFIMLCLGFAAFAIESSKPDTHTGAWGVTHGKQARVNDKECLTCHADRLECIQCHEDVKPRSHTATWTMKGHGMEGRWNKNSCKTCHQEEFCTDCHEVSIPVSHKVRGFGPSTWASSTETAGRTSHCSTSCQILSGTKWSNAVKKDCLVCHKSRPEGRYGFVTSHQ